MAKETKMDDRKAAVVANLAQELILPLASNVVRDHSLHAEDMPYVLVASLIIALQKLREVRKENAEGLAQDVLDSLTLSLQKVGFPIKPWTGQGAVGVAKMASTHSASGLIIPH